jgi:hypothetical protein
MQRIDHAFADKFAFAAAASTCLLMAAGTRSGGAGLGLGNGFGRLFEGLPFEGIVDHLHF